MYVCVCTCTCTCVCMCAMGGPAWQSSGWPCWLAGRVGRPTGDMICYAMLYYIITYYLLPITYSLPINYLLITYYLLPITSVLHLPAHPLLAVSGDTHANPRNVRLGQVLLRHGLGWADHSPSSFSSLSLSLHINLVYFFFLKQTHSTLFFFFIFIIFQISVFVYLHMVYELILFHYFRPLPLKCTYRARYNRRDIQYVTVQYTGG